MKTKAAFFLTLAASWVLALGAAFAGSRSLTQASTVYPDLADAGISLNDSVTCRVSAFVTDGGNVDTCDMKLWNYDPTSKWAPSSAADCKCTTALLPDGGAPTAQGCDYWVASPFGLLGVQWISGLMQDAGTVTPQVRLECWGPKIPGGNGATPW